MPKVPAGRPKHVPQRTCVICRATLPKRTLIRVVRTPSGALAVDARGKQAGRGAYLCPRRECYMSARARSAVAHALEVDISEQDWTVLIPELERLAAERAPALGQAAVPSGEPS
jgi:predicted RNA-binding protein YlxR (DUF448 family)